MIFESRLFLFQVILEGWNQRKYDSISHISKIQRLEDLQASKVRLGFRLGNEHFLSWKPRVVSRFSTRSTSERHARYCFQLAAPGDRYPVPSRPTTEVSSPRKSSPIKRAAILRGNLIMVITRKPWKFMMLFGWMCARAPPRTVWKWKVVKNLKTFSIFPCLFFEHSSSIYSSHKLTNELLRLW